MKIKKGKKSQLRRSHRCNNIKFSFDFVYIYFILQIIQSI